MNVLTGNIASLLKYHSIDTDALTGKTCTERFVFAMTTNPVALKERKQ
jgi:hypothetical protein